MVMAYVIFGHSLFIFHTECTHSNKPEINDFSVNDIIFAMSKIAGKVKNKIGKDTDMSKSVNQGQNQVLNQRKRSGEDLDLQLNKAVQKGKLISVEMILKSNWMKR